MSSLFVMMVSTLVTLGVNQVFTQDVSNTQDATNLLSGQPAGMVSSGGAGIPPQEYHCPDHQIPHAGHRAPFDRRRPPEQSTVRHIQAQGGDPQTRSTNPLTALSSFLSSDTTDNRTPMEILRHFQRLLTRTGMTFPPDVVRPLSQTAARRYTANPAGIRRSIRAACSESRRDHRSENKRTYSSNSVCHNCYPLRAIGIPYSLGRCTVQGCTEIIHMGAFTLPASLRTPSPLRRERNFWRPAPSRHRFRTPPACRNWNYRRSPTPRRR